MKYDADKSEQEFSHLVSIMNSVLCAFMVTFMILVVLAQ